MFKLNKKQAIFAFVFTVIGFLTSQVELSNLVGSKVNFTLFDSFAPIAGAFLGGIVGVASVLVMQVANFVLHGANVLDMGTVIRLFPTLFAVLYFARKSKMGLVVPTLAILAWNLHPVGRSVWYYSLFWLIPVAAHFWQEKSIVARSLGATFTAHAVGGALWMYAFSLPKAVWISLIPVVAVERLLFAAGTAVSFVAVKNIISVLQKRGLVEMANTADQIAADKQLA